MDDGLGVDQYPDPLVRHPEQVVRLDELQSFVHHGRRVNGDLAAHVPIGMRERLGLRGPRHLGARASAERPTRSGQNNPLDAFTRGRIENLENRVVL